MEIGGDLQYRLDIEGRGRETIAKEIGGDPQYRLDIEDRGRETIVKLRGRERVT